MLSAELPVSAETQEFENEPSCGGHSHFDPSIPAQTAKLSASNHSDLPEPLGNQAIPSQQQFGHHMHDTIVRHQMDDGEPNSHARRPSDPALVTPSRDDMMYGSMGGAGSLRQRKSGTRTNNNHHTSQLPSPSSIPNGRSHEHSRRRSSSAQASSSSEPMSLGGASIDSAQNSKASNNIPPPFAYSSHTTTPISSPMPMSNSSTMYNTAAPSLSFTNRHSEILTPTSASSCLPLPTPMRQQHQESIFSYIWPIIFAVTPPVMTILFGSSILWGEMFLLLLTAFYLYWIIKVPWEMYQNVRARRVMNRVAMASHAQPPASADDQTTINFETMSQTYRTAAHKELQRLERYYLCLIVLSPFLGGLGLYMSRLFLSQPNQLISDFNIVLFIVAAGIRPLMLIMNLARSEATRLQEEVNYPNTEVESLKIRVAALENQLAALMEAVASKADLYALQQQHGASLASLSRAVRRAEKRTDQVRGLMEERSSAVDRLREFVGEGVDKSRNGDFMFAQQAPTSSNTNGNSNLPPTNNPITVSAVSPHHPHVSTANLNGGHLYTLYTTQPPVISRFNSSSSRSRSPVPWTTALFVLTTWIVSMIGYIIIRCALFPFTVVGGVIGGILKLLPSSSVVTSTSTTNPPANQKVLIDKVPKYQPNGDGAPNVGSKRGSIHLDDIDFDRKKPSLRTKMSTEMT